MIEYTFKHRPTGKGYDKAYVVMVGGGLRAMCYDVHEMSKLFGKSKRPLVREQCKIAREGGEGVIVMEKLV